MVGEPQGPRGPQRLPGRLPRARQHRRLRSERRAAGRRPPRPGRRNRVDGLLRPPDDADRPRAGLRESRVRGCRDEILRALPVHRRGAERSRRRRDLALGRRGRLLLRRHPPAERLDNPAEGPLARRADAAARRGDARAGRPRTVPDLRPPPALVPPQPAGAGLARPQLGGPWGWPAAASRARPRSPDEAPPRADARRGRIPVATRDPGAQPLPPRPPLRARLRGQPSRGPLRAGRVAKWVVRWQFELARTGLVPAQLPAHRGAPEVPPLLR